MSSSADAPDGDPPAAGALGTPDADLTPQAVRDVAARLITDELVIVPVRHHSPACAWQVARAIEELHPSIVLVEGPSGFDELIPLLADDATTMPVAVFTSAAIAPGKNKPGKIEPGKNQPGEPHRTAAYYPFCDYSPELVAIRAGAAHGVPVRFVDLDHAEQVVASSETPEAEAPDEAPGSLLDERRYDHSAALQLLAARLGCRDGEELWEHLIESGGAARTLTEHVAVLTAYCLLARADHTDADLAADATKAREAEMTWHVAAALAARPDQAGPVLVVVGGFHAVALPDLLAAPPPRPTRQAKVVEGGSSLIRYSFDRLDRLNGYASGMTSPAWHQRVWDGERRRHRAGLPPSPRVREEATLDVLLEIAARARQELRLDLPVPAVQAAYEAALRLAELRGRPGPVRDDVLDAVTSAFVKGDVDGPGRPVLSLARQVLAGTTLGRVPAGAGRPPLVDDVLRRCRRARLKVDDPEQHQVALEVHRSPAHRTTSRLLHGLELLRVPLARRTAGPDFVTGARVERLREQWDYGWSVAVEAALVEASVHGSTLPAAVARRFGQLVDARLAEAPDARAGAQLLVQACVLGLHERLADVAGLLRTAIAGERSFAGAAQAATTLSLLRQAREPLEAWHVPDLPGLVEAAYQRALLLGRDLPGLDASDEQVLRDAVDGLVRVRELLLASAVSAASAGSVGSAGAVGSAGSAAAGGWAASASTAAAAASHEPPDLDPEPFWALVDDLAGGPGAGHTGTAPLLAGAAAGLAYSAGRTPGEALAARIAGHLGGLLARPAAVAFLRGVMLTAREAAWQERDVVVGVDGVLQSSAEDEFVELLPELRLAFADLTPRETDRVADLVAQLHGGARVDTRVRYDLDEDELADNLTLTRDVGAALAADGLAEWVAS